MGSKLNMYGTYQDRSVELEVEMVFKILPQWLFFFLYVFLVVEET